MTGRLNLKFDVEIPEPTLTDMTSYYERQKDGRLMLVAITPNYPIFKE